jgi:hypothetical protein
MGATIQRLATRANLAEVQRQICRPPILRVIDDSNLHSQSRRRQAQNIFGNLLQQCFEN